jgi:hypothetical protein
MGWSRASDSNIELSFEVLWSWPFPTHELSVETVENSFSISKPFSDHCSNVKGQDWQVTSEQSQGIWKLSLPCENHHRTTLISQVIYVILTKLGLLLKELKYASCTWGATSPFSFSERDSIEFFQLPNLQWLFKTAF